MTPLHSFGELLRSAMLQVPMPVVRILFVALPALLLLWVLRLPRTETNPPDRPFHRAEDLRIWASLALAIQIGIYGFF